MIMIQIKNNKIKEINQWIILKLFKNNKWNCINNIELKFRNQEMLKKGFSYNLKNKKKSN